MFWGDPVLQGLHIGLFIALGGAASSSGCILNRSTHRLRGAGGRLQPRGGARTAASASASNYFLVMAICGAVRRASPGALDVLGWQFRIATNDIQIAQIGFIGIAVALLGRNTAVGTVVAALLFGALLSGTSAAQPRPDDLRARAGVEPDAGSSRASSSCSSAPTCSCSAAARGRRRDAKRGDALPSGGASA